jgi:putative transcriptional regulator
MTKEELAAKIGNRIIFLREKKGMSQAKLAKACQRDRQYMERIENGKTNPTAFTLQGIAEALGVPLLELFK